MPLTRIPDLFIVGAPKSGTTSVYEWLKGHPDVYMTPVKEPCFYSRDLAADKSGNFLRYDADRDRYTALFANAGDAKRVGEASTRYLYSKDAARLIAEDQPNAYIVAILRNPVDMIASLHAHKLAGGTEDLPRLEDALAAEQDRHHGKRIPKDSNPHLATYRDRARFGEQVARWYDAFPHERVHVIVFEELVRDPAAHFRRLLQFLDVDPDYQPEAFTAHNPAHGARGGVIRTVGRSRPVQFLAWRVLPALIGDARARAMSRRIGHSKLQRRAAERAQVSPELRRELEAELAPDVAQLVGAARPRHGRDMVRRARPRHHRATASHSPLSHSQGKRRPNLFIVGAPKAGTTSLYEYLRGHPDVYMSVVKEPAYFSPDVPPQKVRFRYDRDLDRYLALFAGATGERYVGEASTYYIYSRMAPKLIHDFDPAARIVAMLRNPVEMAWALHGQRATHGREPITDFEAALAADNQPDAGGSSRRGQVEMVGRYRDRARYAEQLERWFDAFGRKSVHLIVFEDFVADTAGEFSRLLSWLGIDAAYRPESFAVHNPSHAVRRGLVRSAINTAPGRWATQRLLPRLIGFERSTRLAQGVKRSDVGRTTEKRTPIPDHVRHQLEQDLLPDVDRLSALLGRDMATFWFGASDR